MASISNDIASKLGLSPVFPERRKEPRFRVNWHALLDFAGAISTIRVWDISREGLSIITDAAIPLNATLTLLVVGDRGEGRGQPVAVPLKAAVRNRVGTSGGYRLGAHIESIDAASWRFLLTGSAEPEPGEGDGEYREY
ncbi:hypothetical protein PATSB16_12820 [Pandoraea thiooxydans]|uniref:PilZ domain-containing protein n=1 Tax=Pandoraea thiooxydans TaxID=445709 RepID=A0A0G3EQG1_9BURK|nr:PilZ domain-containing protein [Pandoraea thiooxydans]AKJ67547.1 hypothetical protein ABW99_04215 [Pandoraea thiooxydans]APR94624.1 hypothetical protein PATSB16_12820 [Pandoraea thiooxydans]